jgi:phosphoglucomutase
LISEKSGFFDSKISLFMNREFLQRKDFSFVMDGLSGIGGPYAKAVFVDELGVDECCLQNC